MIVPVIIEKVYDCRLDVTVLPIKDGIYQIIQDK